MRLEKQYDSIIYKDGQYNTFPSAAALPDGTLLIGFRQARELQSQYGGVTHVDPASKAVFVASRDGGRTWDTAPSVIADHYLHGIQDPCLNVLRDGSLLCTFFSWKVFDREDMTPLPGDIPVYERWFGRLEGLYATRSSDGGRSWDEPSRITDFPCGVRGTAAELADGSVLVVAYGSRTTEAYRNRMMIMRSADNGRSWSQLAVLSHPDYRLDEPSLLLAPSGKLVAFVRTAPLRDDRQGPAAHPLLTAESLDGGVTWSEWTVRPYYSPSPFHPLRLRSGRVLLTYGYRFAPYGVRAVLLDEECTFADAEETVLREEARGKDIGYTSAVQLPDDSILVSYYDIDDAGQRYIAGIVCKES